MRFEYIIVRAVETALIEKKESFVFSYTLKDETIRYLESVGDFIPKEDVTEEIEDILTYVNLFDSVGASYMDNHFVGFEIHNCKETIDVVITHLKSNQYLTIGIKEIVRYKPFMSLYEYVKRLLITNDKLKFVYLNKNDILPSEDGLYIVTFIPEYPLTEVEVYTLKT